MLKKTDLIVDFEWNGEDEECLDLSDTSCMRRAWIWFGFFVEQIKQLSELTTHLSLKFCENNLCKEVEKWKNE